MVTAARRAGRFGSVVTAMATPFDADGRVDIDGAVALARYLVDNGSDGLVVTGTTGEGPTLSDSESPLAMGGSLASIFRRARSEPLSRPRTFAVNVSPLSEPTSTSSSPWTTWYAVTMCPWSSQTIPVPFLPSELTLTTEGLALSATA